MMYKSMTAEGYMRWPPACNPSDLKVPPNNFGANLTQFTNGKQSNGNGKTIVKKIRSIKMGTVIILKTEMGIITATIRRKWTT